MAFNNAVSSICGLVLVLVTGALGQLAPDHVGNVEDVVDGYRIQYHDETGLLLILKSLDCFVGDLERGTPLADKLEDLSSRMDTQREILSLIDGGYFTPTTLDDVLHQYPDILVRALCFRSEMYSLDLAELQAS